MYFIEQGLISDLKSDSKDYDVIDDAKYCESLYGQERVQPANTDNLYMIVMPHIDIPFTSILKNGDWIPNYRNFILERIADAYDRMEIGGLFVLGIKDCRVSLESFSDSNGTLLEKFTVSEYFNAFCPSDHACLR